MTRIRTTCPQCGEIELLTTDVTMRIALDTVTLVGEDSRYRFHCPGCESMVSKRVTPRIAQLLSTGGVEIEEPHVPDAVAGWDRGTRPEPQAPALTLDDLLDLHLALQDERWFDRIAHGLR